ncbi:MAG: hypothetical protein J6R83_01545 [Clostridia bacterium]|nr:hypothetical protein [Clostridia bacterium]
MKALLIDVGSTFIKYSVYSQANGILVAERTPFPEPLVNDGTRFIVSRKTLEDKIFAVLENCKEFGYSAMFLSVQMHGYVARLYDGTLTEYVSWRDKSGDKNQQKFKNVNFNEYGLSIDNNLPVTKIDGSIVKEFYTLGSYIAYILTGNNATHITDAFASGLYYSPSGEPNQFANGMVMPKVCLTTQVVGEYNGAKVICAFGDHQISVLGSGIDENSYLINIGTGAQICCIAPYGYPDAFYQKRPYFDKQTCLYSICSLYGADGLQRDKESFMARLDQAVDLLPKKSIAIVGGGGGEELFNGISSLLKQKDITCVKADFNVGTQGLIMLADKYFKGKSYEI